MTVIARAPFRVSFIGGGTDVPAFFESHGTGCVVSSAISKHVYVIGTSRFGKRGFSLRYSRNEEVERIEDISHPIIREVLKRFEIASLELSVVAEIPAGTGLGSSSAFTNAMVLMCSRLAGITLTQHQIAEISCEIELVRLREPIGMQDQFASALGGLRELVFTSGNVSTREIKWTPKTLSEFESQYKLVHMGLQPRSASQLLREQFDPSSNEFLSRIEALGALSALASETAEKSMQDNKAIGNALGRAWDLKRKSNPNAHNSAVLDILKTGSKFGAQASKVLGAGGSGFALFWSPVGFTDQFSEGFAALGLHVIDYKVDQEGAIVLKHE